MRYIDADALQKEMKQRQESAYQWYSDAKVKEDEEIMVRADSAMAAFIECRLTIGNQPTADVAPVRHGRWKRVGDTAWECSACGCISCCNGTYCPDCGAKMDGGEE